MDIAELGFLIRSRSVVTATDRLNKMDRASDRAERGAGKLGRRFVALGGSVLAAVATISTLRASMSGALGLSGALAEVSTLLPTVGQNIVAVESAAHDMARTFGTSATNQVKAFYQIFSAGASSVVEASETLEAANRLAIGGVTDIQTAADGLTSVMNAYGDKVESVRAVSDAMFVGMRAGKTTIGELSAALGQVAPLAAQTGVGFDELVASIAALTKGGISTRVAVTGVRAILASVVRPTSQAADMARELGLQFNAAALESKGLVGFLADLVEKTGGSTEKLSMLFGGVEALVPVMALAGQAGIDLGDIMIDMADKAGATDSAFERVAQSADFKVRRSFAKIADVAVIVGQKLLEVAVPAVQALADTISDPDFIRGAVGFGNAIIQTINAISQVAAGAMKAFQDFLDLVNQSGALQHTAQVVGAASQRPIEMLQQQLRDKEALLGRGDYNLFTNQSGIIDRDGLLSQIDEIRAAIEARLDPSQFNIGSIFERLGDVDNPAYDNMEAALQALRVGALGAGDAASQLGIPLIDLDAILNNMSGGSLSAANDNLSKFKSTAEEVQTLADSMRTPFQTMASEIEHLNGLLAQDAIGWDMWAQGVSGSVANAASTVFGSLAQMSSGLSQAFEENKILAVATAVLKGAESIASSFAAGNVIGGPIVGGIYAGIAAITAAANVAAVASVTKTSTSMPSSGGGGAAAGAIPSASSQNSAPAVSIVMNGSPNDMISMSNVEDLIAVINEAVGDGAQIIVKAG